MKTVILAAGFGSRLWPLSTSEQPKQFQHLINDQSLLQYTYAVMAKLTPPDDLYVLTLSGLERLVTEQLPGIKPSNIIIVPERRNTLPHTAYALNKLHLQGDEQVLFTPVDHYLVDAADFIRSLQQTLGNIPSKAETYLLCTKAKTIEKSLGYTQVDANGDVLNFIEKPSPEQIVALSAEDNIYINTLRYVTSIPAFTALLDRVGDGIAAQTKAVIHASDDQVDGSFLAMPMVDVSHGVFEKSSGLKALVVRSGFIDIGKFATLYEISEKDQDGNVVIGAAILRECRNNFCINQLDRPLVLVAVHDSVVVQTASGTIVSTMKDADQVGEIYKTAIHA